MTEEGVKCLEHLRNVLNSAGVRQCWVRKSIGYDKDEAYLSLMLKQVVLGDQETKQKRSNSLIIYGPPGSGKSTFVESTIEKLTKHELDFKSNRAIVRLNGMLCTDFRSSIDEINYQLKFSSIDDEEDVEMTDDILTASNFDDLLEQTLAYLKTNIKSLNKSIIFILDKLELFAEHPNQRLLYNLYNLTANVTDSTPICIVGITDRVDVLELFEKRVKSRFSHRQINIVGGYDFDKYKEIAQHLYSLKLPKTWKESMAELFKEIEIVRILQALYDTDKSMRQLTMFLYQICLIAEDSIKLHHFQQVFKQFGASSKVKTALDLPVSELLGLLSIYKHIQTKHQQAWQPTQLFIYVDKIGASFGMKKEDFYRAVGRLETLELIIPVTGGSQRNGVGETYYKCELTIQELQELWKTYPHLPSSFQELL